LLFDVGGVFLVPGGEIVAAVLDNADIPFDPSAFEQAHYVGITAIDEQPGSGDNIRRYLGGYVAGLGVPEGSRTEAADLLVPVWEAPAIELWRGVLHDSVVELRRFAEAGIPVAIVSNADGTVEQQLRLHDICRVGAGAGVPVLAITDSFHVGVAKPQAEIFAVALEALAVPPERVAYVGDTVRYDVVGARAAGLLPVHHDRFRLCRNEDAHHHTQSLADLRKLLDLDGR
jgi:putative hydrolase of the HAD superfamily